MRAVRIDAMPTEDNPTVEPLHIIAMLNDMNEVIGRDPMFGMQGKFALHGTAKSYPFVLYRNDTLDFGTNHDTISNDRLAKLKLRDKPVREGAILTLESKHGGSVGHTFRVSKISTLPLQQD